MRTNFVVQTNALLCYDVTTQTLAGLAGDEGGRGKQTDGIDLAATYNERDYKIEAGLENSVEFPEAFYHLHKRSRGFTHSCVRVRVRCIRMMQVVVHVCAYEQVFNWMLLGFVPLLCDIHRSPRSRFSCKFILQAWQRAAR